MTADAPIHVLLVEDDAKLAALLREYLERQGVTLDLARDGARGLDEALRRPYDAVLLDIMLPQRDGIQVCQEIRRHKDVPVIMLTARGEEADRVLGLEVGADDYMTKPFSPRELLARLRAVVRRARGEAGPPSRLIVRGDLELDPGSLSARLAGVPLDLTPYEFALLSALAGNAGRVLSRERLMDLARPDGEEVFDRAVDVHISRLRKKLGDDPQHPCRIKTVRGAGYLYMPRERP